MTPQTARTLSAVTFVAAVVTLVLLGASGCRSIEPYLAVIGLAVMAVFVGLTQDI
jgi:general stress protein CsbA